MGATEEEIDAYVNLVRPQMDALGTGSSYDAPTSELSVPTGTERAQPIRLPGAVVTATPPAPDVDPLPPARGATRTFGEPTALERIRKTRDEWNAKQRELDEIFGGPGVLSPERTSDLATSVAKGVIAVPEAAVGLADIATGGHAGRLLERAGYKPGEAKQILEEDYSEPQQRANRAVQEAEGVLGKLKAAVTHPSTIVQTTAESVPLMLGGAGVARGIMTAAPKVGAVVAGAAGEGAAAAGSAAEQIRQQTDDGLLSPKQAALAAGSGIATGALGVLGGKIAQRMGIADIETALASAATSPAIQRGFVQQLLYGAAQEGLLEELPQSIQEQVAQNLALDRPPWEGVDESAVMGALSGGLMGAGFQATSRARDMLAAGNNAVVSDKNGIEMPLQSAENPAQIPTAPGIPTAPQSVRDMEIPVNIRDQQPPAPEPAPVAKPAGPVYRVTAMGKDGAQFTSEPPAPDAPGYDVSDALISENMDPDAAKAQGFDGARLPDGSTVVWNLRKLKPIVQEQPETDSAVIDIQSRTDIGPAEKEMLVRDYRQRQKQLEEQAAADPSAVDRSSARTSGLMDARAGTNRNPYRADSALYQEYEAGYSSVPKDDEGAYNVLRKPPTEEGLEQLEQNRARRLMEEVVEAEIEPAGADESEPTPTIEAKVESKPAPEDESDIRVIARRVREFEERTKAEWYLSDPSWWDDEEKQRWLDANPTDRLWMVVHRANHTPPQSSEDGRNEADEVKQMTAMAVDRLMQEGVPILDSFREWEVKVTPEVEKVASAIEQDRSGKKPPTPQIPPIGGKYVLPSFVTDPHKKPAEERAGPVTDAARDAIGDGGEFVTRRLQQRADEEGLKVRAAGLTETANPLPSDPEVDLALVPEDELAEMNRAWWRDMMNHQSDPEYVKTLRGDRAALDAEIARRNAKKQTPAPDPQSQEQSGPTTTKKKPLPSFGDQLPFPKKGFAAVKVVATGKIYTADDHETALAYALRDPANHVGEKIDGFVTVGTKGAPSKFLTRKEAADIFKAARGVKDLPFDAGFENRDELYTGDLQEDAKPKEPKTDREFSSTQLDLPPDLAREVIQLGKFIPNADLAEDGREDKPHITVKFGLHTNNADDVARILEHGPITVRLGKVTFFPNGESGAGDVVKIDVESEGLRALNAHIAESLEHTDTHPDYKPHVTIAYVKPGLGKIWAKQLEDRLKGRSATFETLTFSGKDRSKHVLPLDGREPEVAPGPEDAQTSQREEAPRETPEPVREAVSGDARAEQAGAVPEPASGEPSLRPRVQGGPGSELRVPEPAGEAPGRPAAAEGRSGEGAATGGDREPSTGDRDERDPGAGRGDRESGERRGLRVARNLVITPELEQSIGTGGPVTRARANIAAIETLKAIEAEQRPATEEEQRALVKYVGWGGIKGIFNEKDAEWGPLREKLKNLLTEEEFAAARASVLNAHYTSLPVIRAMWTGMRRLGFTGRARVLEPSMGVGHFLGALPDGLRSAVATGIELDSITGRIAKLLYPESTVHVAGFEDVKLAENSFDIAISNIPFGEYPVADKKYGRDLRTFIHNYFFAKAIDVVRPGGIVAFITSKGTMDGSTAHAVREYLKEKSKLVAAFRLPNTAFKGNAGTEVTTDIIIVQKLMPDEKPGGESWLEVNREWKNAQGATIPLNEYFVRNGSHMLGEMTLAGTMYGPGQATLEPIEGAVLADQLTQAMKSLPEGIVKAAPAESPATRETVIKPGIDITAEDQKWVRDGGFLVARGTLYQRDGDRLITNPVPAKHVDRVSRLARIKHLYQEVRELQTENADDKKIKDAQRRLTKEHDDFVKKYGPINKQTRIEVRRKGQEEPAIQIRLPNLQHFTDDPEFPRVTALERYDQETNTVVGKADIFTKKVLGTRHERPQITSAVDALPVVLNEAGHVDLDRISKLASVTEDEALEQLGALVYRDPIKGEWQTADQYLSGNVREKLKEAKRLAKIRPELQRNVEALEKVQPEDLKPSQIGAGLGAPWIPEEDIENFVRDLLGQRATVKHAINSNIWAVSPHGYAKHVEATNDWGTEKRTAYALIEDALNGRTPTITIRHRDGTSEVDKKATALAQAKLQLIKDRFAKWIWEDSQRATRLARYYNDNYNVIRLPSFDGSFLELPGAAAFVNGKPFALMQHQKNAIWRILQNGTTLLAHIVGAGKTFTMVAAGMEAKRLGLAKKPMYVVPNHMLNQFSNELLQLYPNAKILVATKDDFAGEERRKFTARVAAENWDAVIMTHSSFERIPMSKAARQAEVKRQVKDLEEDIRDMKSGKDERSIVRELEVALKKLRVRLDEIMAEEKKDDLLDFEELGIDMLFVDEAHLFKNLFIRSRMRGMAAKGAERSFDLYLKSIFLEQTNPGRGMVFATGTPISNSMAEMFTLLRYLMPRALRDRQIAHFDAWAASFGDTVTSVELKHTGKYSVVTRFARFKNVPELLQMFRLVADVQMDPVALGLKRPDLIGGKVETVIAPVTQRLKAFIAGLAARAEKLSPATKEIDNHLKITTDGRLAALDMRLVDRTAPADPEGKLAIAARKIAEKWRQTKDLRGAQLVFLDVSTPGGGDTEAHINRGGLPGFSGYEELKRLLVDEGVPAKEIAFMQDADSDTKKQRLFDAVREGRVRVLLGSTAKMGAGTNVQKKLVALHHVDVPWKPAEIEQRNGRILRQGNDLWDDKLIPGVSVTVYATEGSFDVYMWQTVQRKAKFIAQMMQGDLTVREMEDVDEMVLTAAEIMALASDNPLVMEKVTLENELSKLYLLQGAHRDAQFAVRRNIADLENTIGWRRKEADAIEKDVARRQETKGDKFRITIRGKEYADRKKAGEVLEALARELIEKESEKGSFSETVHDIGDLAGFELKLRAMVRKGATAVQLSLKGELLYEGGALTEPTGEGLLASGEAIARRPSAEHATQLRSEIPEFEKDLAGYRSKLGEKFDKEDEVQKKEARLKQVIDELTKKEKEGQQPDSQQAAPEEEPDVEEDDDFDDDGEYGAPEPQESEGFKPPLKAAYLAESGKTYTGATHDRAVEAAAAAGEPEVQDFPHGSDAELKAIEDRMGFTDSRGRYLTRDESYELFGVDASEHLPDDISEYPADPLKDDDAEIGAPSTIGNELAGELTAVPGIQRISAPEVIRALGDVTEATGKRIPQRVGRIASPKWLGIFKPKQMVIRTRNANDVAVAAHEVGHAIEVLLFGESKGGPWRKPRASPKMQRELAKIGHELYDPSTPAAGYKREGWAEFIRMWVTESSLQGQPLNPAAKMPLTNQWFDDSFSKEFPEIRQKFDAARDAARRWRLQGSRARAEESIVDTGDVKHRVKRAGQAVKRALSKERFLEMAQPLLDLVREVEATTGQKLASSANPMRILEALRTVHDARTLYMVEKAMIDLAGNPVGDPLAVIRQLVKPKQRVDFMVYLWARRAIALWTDPQGPRNAGLSLSDAQQIVLELDSQAFQLAAAKVYAWNEGVLDYAAQASPTFREVVKNVRARDPGHYIPLQREFEELDAWWQQQGKAGATKRSPVKRLQGSGRRIKDPFPIMISQASKTLRQAHERMVLDQIIRISGLPGMGHILEEVPKHMVPAAHATLEQVLDRLAKEFGIETERTGNEAALMMTFFAPAQRPDGKDPIFPIYDQGVVRWFQVPGKLYETLAALDVYRLPDTVGLWGKLLLEFPATLMRAGTTGVRASFGLIWNPLRDLPTMYVNTRSRKMGAVVFFTWGRAMAQMALARGGFGAAAGAIAGTLTAGPLGGVLGATAGAALQPKRLSKMLDAWMRLGGEMAQSLGQDMNYTRRAARRLFESPVQRAIDPRNWWDWYRDVVQFPEGAPRVAEMELLAKEIGWTPGTPMTLDQSLELLLASKQVTTDFTAAGSFARMMNRIIPFFNPAIQGPRANFRALRRNPSQFVARGLEMTMITLLLWWLYKDEEWWKSMPLRDRFMHWFFPVTIDGKEELVKIPRPFDVGMIFAALPEMAADAWYREDPEQAIEWFKTLMDVSTPELLPVLGQVGMEQWRNRQWPDRPIVPRSVEQKPAEEQFNEYTSKAAILIGDIFGKSPMRIDHIIEGVGGPVAGDLLEALGVGPAEIEREEEPADLPVVGRVFQRGGRIGIQPRQIEDLYDTLAEAQLKQHSDRDPETRVERQHRLQLEDAAKAVSALILVRRYTKGAEDRKKITAQARELAERAMRAHEAGQRDRPEFRAERNKAQINRRRVEAGKEPIRR